MHRFLALLLVAVPAALLAQTPAAKPSEATRTPPTQAAPATQKPAAPATQKPAAPRPATAKPAPKPAPKPAAVATAPLTDEEKTIYALGLLMQRPLRQFDLSPAEVEIIKRAIGDAAVGKPAVELSEWGPKVEGLADVRAERVTTREKAAATAYLTKAAAETGAVRTDSGLVYKEMSAGTGPSPTAADAVRVHYRGTLINGTEFDSSYTRNEPARFGLAGVIPCWTEGVQRMKVGGKAHLVCPSDLAYGDRGNEVIPGGAALVFEVELLEIVGTPGPQ